MADLRITDLTALPEGDVAATDVLPIADISASETKKVTAKDLVEAGVALIDDASIPSAKLAAITPASLGNSAAAAQFIAGPTLTGGPFSARTIAAGDLPLATNAAAGAVVVGTGLSVSSGTVSAAVATSATRGAVSIPAASGLSVDGSGVISHQSSVTAQTKNGFTVNSTGHVTAVGSIVSTDLPVATTTDVGGIFVGSGLAVTVAGELNHASSITAGTTSGITYNASGHITGVTALTGSDLPVATDGVIGAISVPAGALSVDGAGALTHDVSAVTPGAYAKVTVDSRGHVTAGTTLSAADIPEISAAKITSGTLANTLFGTKSIPGTKLADESTVLFGGAGSTAGVVTFPTAQFKGQCFWNELNNDLYIWTGSAWLPVTITSGELVYAGTYDASTNLVNSVTADGSSIGLVVGVALPAASPANSQYYVVVSDSGTGAGNAPAVSLVPPDMLVSNGTTWDLIDVSNAIAGQTAGNIDFTPYGNIIATNVQAALQELDDEKLTASGGTITGVLEIGTTGSLRWEGSSADDYETTLAVVNPTADRTITLPDITGTVITTADTGTVTNTMLAGSIADSKLNTISTANKISLAAVDIDGGTDIGTALADADLFIVDDGGSGTNRKAAATRITDYAFGKVSGDITIASNGTAAIGSGVIVDADVNASAAIAGSKIQAGTTSNAGALQLTDSTSSTSTTTAATPAAVKSAYDLANAAMPKAGGTFTGSVYGITAASGTNTTEIATTAFVQDAVSGASPAAGFPSGTVMLFQQTAAPTGWTKITTHDNKALRVVSGTVSSGGSSNFTTVFASRTPAGSVSVSGSIGNTTTTGSVFVSGTVGSTTLSTSQMPSHTHSYNSVSFGSGLASGSYVTGSGALTTGATGGSGSHTHSFSGSGSFSANSHNHTFSGSGSFTGTAMDFAVAYVDVIFASKD